MERNGSLQGAELGGDYFCVTQIEFFVNRPGKGGSIALNRRDSFVNRPEKEGSVAVIKPRKE
eukprot:3912410-Prymnesium_polylepis.1